MNFRPTKLIFMLALGFLVAACGRGESIFDKNGDFKIRDAGPDEFSIIPTKPLEIPEDTVTLPEPTLGSKNRVDLEPDRDAITALGGNPERLDSELIASDEQALIAAASRSGVPGNIRDQIDADAKVIAKKRKPRFFQRWIGHDGRLQTYKSESLDPVLETDRLRRQGVRTPSVRIVE
ncbi:DUF3035 domain-containing protein [Amylibacter sp. SFDW26]|uniref:DUF3035 domain-containing protein n=1 Tax=Amylibacter sp. SFDW26 TaxID=2652722 RepID=UPI00126257BF|nr:DUF3035 domain-containing protein [Amylibacter sp. SFDW26]KAB7614308.1 DUF3035 domain-containing protein [Amylibacter sp. SFDW26]